MILGGDLTAISFSPSRRYGALQATRDHRLRFPAGEPRKPQLHAAEDDRARAVGFNDLPGRRQRPVDWLTANCTIVSVFFSSGGPKPSSASAA
jgi:hypothetical protein